MGNALQDFQEQYGSKNLLDFLVKHNDEFQRKMALREGGPRAQPQQPQPMQPQAAPMPQPSTGGASGSWGPPEPQPRPPLQMPERPKLPPGVDPRAGSAMQATALAQQLRGGPPPQPRPVGRPESGGSSSVTNTATTPAAPSQSDPTSGARRSADSWYEEGERLQSEAPDYSALQEGARQRGDSSRNALIMALAAQQAGRGFDPISAHFMRQSQELGADRRVEGGYIDSSGQVHIDPGYRRQQQTEAAFRRGDRAAGAEQRAQEFEARQAENVRQFNIRQDDLRQQHADRMALQADNLALRKAIADGKNPPGGGKPLSDAKIEHLAGLATNVNHLGALVSSYQDSYGPTITGTGKATNAVGAMFGTDASNWYSRYQQFSNEMLKQLSGAAVTAPEMARFEAAMISPNTPPQEVRRRLAQQRQALSDAHDRLLLYYGQGGKDVSGFQPLGVRGAPAPGGRAAPAGSGGWTIERVN